MDAASSSVGEGIAGSLCAAKRGLDDDAPAGARTRLGRASVLLGPRAAGDDADECGLSGACRHRGGRMRKCWPAEARGKRWAEDELMG